MWKTEAPNCVLESDEDRNPPSQAKLNVVEPADQKAAKRPGVQATVVRFVFATHLLALVDQAVFSGTSLLATVLVGRWTSPSQLAIYTIGISVLVSVLAVQDALILLPYTIRRQHPSCSPAEHAAISLLHTGLLAALAILALLLAAAAMPALGIDADMSWLMLALVFAVPFALHRELGRTYAFAHLELVDALVLDTSVAALQLGILGWLGWTGRMSAFGACLALGSGCALTSLIWLYRSRSKFTVRMDRVRQATSESWALGKWLCAGQITASIQGYASFWMLPLLVGMAETGVYAASNSIASLANPLLAAFRNTQTPRAVRAFREGGGVQLRRQTVRAALLLAGVMSLFCVVILIGGDTLMRLVYKGPEYGGVGHVVTILAAAVLAGAVGNPASNALASMERPRAILPAAAGGATVTVAAVWVFSIEWGLTGAAYGFLLGSSIGAAGRWTAFLVLVRSCESRAVPIEKADPFSRLGQAMQVLHEFTRAADRDWSILKFDEGEQADIFLAELRRRFDVQAQRRVIIKLYKSRTASRVELARRQFECLSLSHALLGGRTFNGWRVSAPVPVHLCLSPPALVMTMVPGMKLSWHLRTGGELTREIFDTAAEAVVGAMKDHWARQPHGDLNIDNIVLDPVAREISVVDPDLPTVALHRCDDANPWRHALEDLAYMLYSAAMEVKCDIARPRVRARKLMFAERVLRAFVATIAGCEDKMRVIDEIHARTQLHLRAIEMSWSPQGHWRRLVRRNAARCIDRILERLKSESLSLRSLPADALARYQ
jgi:O-antigen/teichoic acid export membrane protein